MSASRWADSNPLPVMSRTVFSLHSGQLLLRGIHLGLTTAMKHALATQAEKLFRHEPDILRVRIDVTSSLRGGVRDFTAKGRIEIAGPDLAATVTTTNAYVSINRLIAKLDRMLRKRATARVARRTGDDIRAYAGAALRA